LFGFQTCKLCGILQQKVINSAPSFFNGRFQTGGSRWPERGDYVSLRSVLGRIGKGLLGAGTAEGIVTAINPVAGAISALVLNAIAKAEAHGGTATDKKQRVVAEVTPFIQPLIATVLTSEHVPISVANIDSDGIRQAVDKLADGVIALLDAIEVTEAAATGGAAGASPDANEPATPPAASQPPAQGAAAATTGGNN
jgi:hypothetical protein